MKKVILFLYTFCFLFQSACLASPSSFMPKKATLTTSFDQGILSFYQKEFEKVTNVNIFHETSAFDGFQVHEVIQDDKQLQLWLFEYREDSRLNKEEIALLEKVEAEVEKWHELYQNKSFETAWSVFQIFLEVLVGKYDIYFAPDRDINWSILDKFPHPDQTKELITTLITFRNKINSNQVYQKLGKFLFEFWQQTNWHNQTKSFAPWLANIYSYGAPTTESFFAAYSNTLWMLKDLPLEDRMISYLTIAMNNALHNNHFGFHIEKLNTEGEKYLLADMSHFISVMKLFLEDLNVYLTQDEINPMLLEFLKYGIKVVMNPLIHHPKLGGIVHHEKEILFLDVSDFVLNEMNLSSDQFIFSILNLILDDFFQNEKIYSRRLFPFMKESLEVTEEEWKGSGYFPPLKANTRNMMLSVMEYLQKGNEVKNDYHPMFEFFLLERYREIDRFSISEDKLSTLESYAVSEEDVVASTKPSFVNYRLSPSERQYLLMKYYHHSLGLELDIDFDQKDKIAIGDSDLSEIVFEDHLSLLEDPNVTKVSGILNDEEMTWIIELFNKLILSRVFVYYKNSEREYSLTYILDSMKTLIYHEGIILDRNKKNAYLYLPREHLKLNYFLKKSLSYAEYLYNELIYIDPVFANDNTLLPGNLYNYDPQKKLKELLEEKIVLLIFEAKLNKEKVLSREGQSFGMGQVFKKKKGQTEEEFQKEIKKISDFFMFLFGSRMIEARNEDVLFLINKIFSRALKIKGSVIFKDFYLTPVIQRMMRKNTFPYELEYSSENRLIITKKSSQVEEPSISYELSA